MFNTPTEDVRERILAAAKTEFSARGLKGASTRAVAARAGVTAAMINYYFRSKLALYEAVVESAMGNLIGRLSRAIAAQSEGELPARLAAAYFDFLSEERELQRLLMWEVLAGGASVPALARKYLAPFQVLVEGDPAAFQAAVSLFGAIAGGFLYAPVLAELAGGDPLSPERLAERRRHIVALASRSFPGGNSTHEPARGKTA